jgi:hypothetical protein
MLDVLQVLLRFRWLSLIVGFVCGFFFVYRGAEHRWLVYVCVCVKIEFLNFLNFEILHTSEFGFLFVVVRVVFFVCHHGAELWRQLLLQVARKRCEWCLFIIENGRLALEWKERVSFCDFWHIKMISHNKTLKRPFSKLKKHHPTNLYMLYPMAQSVVSFHVEIDKKIPPCPPWSSSIIQRPNENYFGAQARSYQNLNVKFWMLWDSGNPHRLLLAQTTHSVCHQEALPAKV